jgi:Tol biopolymer transport system component
MNADGSSQRRVGDSAGLWPVWSPDGTRIAYAGEPGRDDGSIYVVNADGTATRLVSADSESFGLAWSPDGTQIAYGVKDGIALVQVDGRGKRVLPTDSGKDPWRPAWSPDGRRIAFLSGGLYVTDVAGSGETKLTEAEGPPTPAWSPDGRQIVFARDNQIYVINADGTGERQLKRSAWGEEFDAPTWSPDGTRIAFLRGSFSGYGANDVWIMNADGSEAHVLVTPLAQDGLGDDSPVWTVGGVSGGRAAAPRRIVTLRPTRRLSALAPVSSSLAADGSRAATALGCAVATWDASTGSLATTRSCGNTVEPAVADKLTAWILDEAEGHSVDQSTLFVSQAGARPRKEAFADHLRGENLANLFGDGSLLVFNTWRETRSRVTQARLWRIDGKRKTLVRSGADALPVVAVDGDRIATLRPDGRLILLSADGKRLSALSLGRGIEGVQLDGAQLVVLRRATLEVYDLRSGRLARRRPTQLGVSGDVRLEDVDHGIAVYVAGLEIHLLRLSDGRDIALRLTDEGSEAHAQLEPAGLFYAYNQAWTTKPGRLGFVPLRAIELGLRQAR